MEKPGPESESNRRGAREEKRPPIVEAPRWRWDHRRTVREWGPAVAHDHRLVVTHARHQLTAAATIFQLTLSMTMANCPLMHRPSRARGVLVEAVEKGARMQEPLRRCWTLTPLAPGTRPHACTVPVLWAPDTPFVVGPAVV
ncbi:hypothetical protein MTO96_004369 [Rhipicephalus appendiculatus]